MARLSTVAGALAAAAVCGVASAQGYGPINNLPGWAQSSPNMWSGYITVNATHGRALFFWFVESSNANANTLVTWTNGGPGCSSLGGGLFSEHGPFRPDPAGSGNLVPNTWSWHQSAHMLYVEQPAGVGFSYSNTTADYTTGDAQSAADYYAFLQAWLSTPEFSKYRALPLYMSGESYGGHYVPTTTAYIVSQNAGNSGQPKINLAGMLVGNAWTNAFWDNTGTLETWFWRHQISNDTKNGVLATCNMSTVGPLLHTTRGVRAESLTEVHEGMTLTPGAMGWLSKRPVRDASGAMALPTLNAKTCSDYQNDAATEQGNTDIYCAYCDVCNGGASESSGRFGFERLARNGKTGTAKRAIVSSVGEADLPDSNIAAGCSAEYDPCVDDKTGAFLNRVDVQSAIHVVPALIPGGQWVGCSGLVNYSYQDLLSSMLPTYQYLLEAFPTGRYLVYSGDIDDIVATAGTRMWLNDLAQQLGLNVTVSWHPYNTPQTQVAGWSFTLTAPNGAQLTFASVRNAGHLVPTIQGSRGLQLFTTWVSGQSP